MCNILYIENKLIHRGKNTIVTPSFTRFKKQYKQHNVINTKTIYTIYQSFGGYPEDTGKELAEFIKIHQLNNIKNNAKPISPIVKWVDEGIECLAALFVKKFKSGPGFLFIYSLDADSRGKYEYKIEKTIDYEFIVRVYKLIYDHTTNPYKIMPSRIYCTAQSMSTRSGCTNTRNTRKLMISKVYKIC